MKKLYIIRGLPGSGKSALAQKLSPNTAEADEFMYENGIYKWSPDKIYHAHILCQRKVERFMMRNCPTIAVANTFVKKREYKKYIDLAKYYGYVVEIIVCKEDYGTMHNVPNNILERMKKRFDE